MDNPPTCNVLFVCTGNFARSILAEALLNAAARGRFRAFSAGSQPKGEVHPLALRGLQALRIPITLKRRLDLLLALPMERLDRLAVQRQAREIGSS